MRRTTCKICKIILKGRSDKAFCSARCKSYYHKELRKVTHQATKATDNILHRNRSILLELMGKNSKQKKVNQSLLDKKKFNRQYMTGYFENAQGKRYHIVYDFAWMAFSNGEVLIVRRSSK